MVGSENESLAITVIKEGDLGNDTQKIGDDFSSGQDLNSGIVNQYGQLMGDYSKLDDELWLSESQVGEGGEGSNGGVQCHIVPFHDNIVDLAQQSDNVENSVSHGFKISTSKKSSSLLSISRNQSHISSPVSVLQIQHNQVIEHNSSGGLQSLGPTFSNREHNQGFESDQSEYSFGSSILDDSEESISAKHQVRTRKISDLLDLNAEPPKKCLHCDASETPQWRTGPMGRKTLCNACGVQYKNGRLLPDYRPLRSPTFNPMLHSNLTKKVHETRLGKIVESSPNPTPKPKKLKTCASIVDPSLHSNLGNDVQEVRVLYTSERHPHLTPNSKKVERNTPVVDTSLLAILDKKVQEMIACSTSARDSDSVPEPKRAQETRMGGCNEVQSRAERAKKFQQIREQGGNSLVSDSKENDHNSDAKDILKPRKSMKEVKKCLHCDSTKTPQWREGPMGRNTLCNACGVQYRHGRLFPEYCPLKSPKYDPSVHSHLPKKVLEMRMRNSEKCSSFANC